MTSLIAFALISAAAQAQPKILELEIEGIRRQATIYAPSNSKGNTPLVFGFHGHGGNMRNAARSFQVHELWPEAVVVYPQGLPSTGMRDPQGEKPGWQQQIGQSGDRDLKFFDALLKQIEKDYTIDRKRIYAMGHSNGGRFTNVLWAARQNTFAAFGISGSYGAGLLYRMSAKPAFLISGETDPLVPFERQQETLKALLTMNKCPSEGKNEGLHTTYKSPSGNDIETYIHPGGHEYPREANALMVEFFKHHSKP
jgi:polyhydroxybutyrate depolymerase